MTGSTKRNSLSIQQAIGIIERERGSGGTVEGHRRLDGQAENHPRHTPKIGRQIPRLHR
jgi:hypothetical protein